MRISFMRGARRLMIVVMKLTPPRIELIPRIESPTTQKSVFRSGEKRSEVRFAYPVHPASGARFANQLAFMNSEPNRKIQYESAFRRGKATSRAPIWSGTI